MRAPSATSHDSALYEYGARASGERHGVVLTKPHVVDLVLDLAGYVADRDLGALTLLEPASGHGAFLVRAAERLVSSARRHGRDLGALTNAMRAYDVDVEHVTRSRSAVSGALESGGLSVERARRLARQWVRHGDFLLTPHEAAFDVVVGNPPYVRVEQVPEILRAQYRARYQSIYDRADLYVAFIEQGLRQLRKGGVLSFVCADRWTTNKYGGPLRRLVADEYGLRTFVDLGRASPFESQVAAYPAVFAIGKERGRKVRVARLATASPDQCAAVLPMLRGKSRSNDDVRVHTHEGWFSGSDPWVLGEPEELGALRALEDRFAPLESHGRTRVGIGVATGSDAVYIVGEDADIEPDRLVPLVMRDHIDAGLIRNGHRFVINVFGADGRVVDLARFPRLSRYLERHGDAIRRRHVARKNPARWYRTIDRVYPELVATPKLLVSDIAGSNEVVFDRGLYHPHHNLYFVTSDVWDLEILGGLMSSKVALFFVWSYAVKMRGDYLRFQAQYLRRIRVPAPSSLPTRLGQSLRSAFRARDFARIDELALRAYGIAGLPAFSFVETRK